MNTSLVIIKQGEVTDKELELRQNVLDERKKLLNKNYLSGQSERWRVQW